MSPARLRATLIAAGVAWVEDPSNVDRTALRPRLRLLRGDRDGTGSATVELVAAAAASARQRARLDERAAAELAENAMICPEGFAILSGGPLDPAALSALLQAIAGAPFPPPTGSVIDLAAAPGPATLAGVRLLPAGRLGPGLLVVREAAAMASPVLALAGTTWDRRFRLAGTARFEPSATLGALGADAARLRKSSPLPAAVLRTLPAIRLGTALLAVPHLVYPDREGCEGFPVLFNPPRPAAAAPFWFGDA